MLIYEANKDVIGLNPGIVRPGTVLKIPELPPEMKGQKPEDWPVLSNR